MSLSWDSVVNQHHQASLSQLSDLRDELDECDKQHHHDLDMQGKLLLKTLQYDLNLLYDIQTCTQGLSSPDPDVLFSEKWDTAKQDNHELEFITLKLKTNDRQINNRIDQLYQSIEMHAEHFSQLYLLSLKAEHIHAFDTLITTIRLAFQKRERSRALYPLAKKTFDTMQWLADTKTDNPKLTSKAEHLCELAAQAYITGESRRLHMELMQVTEWDVSDDELKFHCKQILKNHPEVKSKTQGNVYLFKKNR